MAYPPLDPTRHVGLDEIATVLGCTRRALEMRIQRRSVDLPLVKVKGRVALTIEDFDALVLSRREVERQHAAADAQRAAAAALRAQADQLDELARQLTTTPSPPSLAESHQVQLPAERTLTAAAS